MLPALSSSLILPYQPCPAQSQEHCLHSPTKATIMSFPVQVAFDYRILQMCLSRKNLVQLFMTLLSENTRQNTKSYRKRKTPRNVNRTVASILLKTQKGLVNMHMNPYTHSKT
jgi:hypothetical protein